MAIPVAASTAPALTNTVEPSHRANAAAASRDGVESIHIGVVATVEQVRVDRVRGDVGVTEAWLSEGKDRLVTGKRRKIAWAAEGNAFRKRPTQGPFAKLFAKRSGRNKKKSPLSILRCDFLLSKAR